MSILEKIENFDYLHDVGYMTENVKFLVRTQWHPIILTGFSQHWVGSAFRLLTAYGQQTLWIKLPVVLAICRGLGIDYEYQVGQRIIKTRDTIMAITIIDLLATLAMFASAGFIAVTIVAGVINARINAAERRQREAINAERFAWAENNPRPVR
jgi:hypothetical protein